MMNILILKEDIKMYVHFETVIFYDRMYIDESLHIAQEYQQFNSITFGYNQLPQKCQHESSFQIKYNNHSNDEEKVCILIS